MGEVATLRAGGGVQAILPQSIEDAYRLATAFTKAGMCPQGIDTQEKALVVIMAGAEIGMAPFQAMQSFALINGRPTLWGDGMLAIVRRFGVKVSERIEGDGDAMKAVCIVTRSDTGETIERGFSVDDAKAAKLWGKTGRDGKPTPWVTYPKRMLQMRARAWALRDGCADMLRGMKMAEEVQDYTEVISDEPAPVEGGEENVIDGKGYIGGEAWTFVRDHYTKLFAEAATLEALEKDWKSFERKYWTGKARNISHNSHDGMAHLYEQAKERFETADTLLPKLRDAIAAAETLAALEEWHGGADTQARIARLPEEVQRDVATLYEARQEELAEAEAEARKNG